MVKFISAKEVFGLIKDGDTIYTTGMMMAGLAEEAMVELERAFLAAGHPRDLTLYTPVGQGNFKDKGMAHFAYEGTVKRFVAAHYGVGGPRLSELVRNNQTEAYNWPQGVLAVMPRQITGRRGGVFTKVGLGTFVDPRLEGGKVNQRAEEDLIQVRELDGEEFLYFKPPKVDVALIHGTTADEHGNLTLDREGQLTLTLETGPIGGVPAGGPEFGHSVDPEVIVEHSAQFDFYDGGGIDIAYLGLAQADVAQADAEGNVNVSKFGGRAVGCGGFINISQNAKKVALLGTFTAGGLKVAVEDGRVRIVQEADPA
jgi:acyl CoA:acetate/3-ketoacid CoA transferase